MRPGVSPDKSMENLIGIKMSGPGVGHGEQVAHTPRRRRGIVMRSMLPIHNESALCSPSPSRPETYQFESVSGEIPKNRGRSDSGSNEIS